MCKIFLGTVHYLWAGGRRFCEGHLFLATRRGGDTKVFSLQARNVTKYPPAPKQGTAPYMYFLPHGMKDKYIVLNLSPP